MTVLSGLRVLVVDNEPAILEGMRLLLSGWGCEVWIASDLEGAQEIIRTHKAAPEVIIADYHLDEGDGLDLIRVLRWKTEVTTPGHPRHGRPDAGGAGRGRRTCNVHVLNKPVKPAALRALLTQWRATRVAAE